MTSGGTVSVATIVGGCGLGRNTFYEHFATVEEAVGATVAEAADTLEGLVTNAFDEDTVRTPSEQAKALGRALVEFGQSERPRWTVLRSNGSEALDAVLLRLVHRLHAEYVRAGAGRAHWTALGAAATAGAVKGIVEGYERRRGACTEVEVIEALGDVVGRLLR